MIMTSAFNKNIDTLVRGLVTWSLVEGQLEEAIQKYFQKVLQKSLGEILKQTAGDSFQSSWESARSHYKLS